MVKIALIDSGADIFKTGIDSKHAVGIRIFRDARNEIRFEEGNINDTVGHGTSCLSILHAYAPDALYCIVKIFDDQLVTDADVLTAAINYCIQADADVINISSGILSDYMPDEMVRACELAFTRNIVIVAAAHNQLKTSFPSCYPKVIGVGSIYLDSPDDFIFQEGSPIEFYTCDHPPGHKLFVTYGTSFSCPKITGRVAQIIKANGRMGFTATRDALIQQARPSSPPPHIACNTGNGFHDMAWYDRKAVVETANKYLLRNKKFHNIRNLLVAPLNDTAFSRLADLEMGSLQNSFQLKGSFQPHHQAILPDIFVRKLNHDTDTIAIGRIAEYIFPGNEEMVYRGLNSLLRNGKHFMVFDEDSASILAAIQSAISSTSQIYLPKFQTLAEDDISRFRYLPCLKAPVVAVAGTGDQPVISFQVLLKKALEKLGYDVEYISPIPHGDLIEACFSFPLVYWKHTKHAARDTLMLLRNLLRGVQEFCRPDIIVTGLVDRVVSAGNSTTHAWSDNANFLQAVQPDALIIVVGEDSCLSEIEENCQVARAYAKAPVLTYFAGSEKTCSRLHHFFYGKPVVIGSRPDALDAVAKAVKDFFLLKQEETVPPVHTTANLIA